MSPGLTMTNTMRLLCFGLFTALVLPAQTLPKVTSVLNGASFANSLCPGALASVFGSGLATATTSAQSIPLATELAGTRVLIQDPSIGTPLVAPLYFVSPGQINFQIPFEVVRTTVTVTVSTAQGNSAPFTVNLDKMAPGIFSTTSNGAGEALVFDSAFNQMKRTPDLGSTIILYATGLGATTPPAKSGSAGAALPPFNAVANPFDVYIGGTKATVAWAGLAPGFVGVYQVNIVPKGVAVGDVLISCDCLRDSNQVRMPEAPLNTGNNITNATGSVNITYPTGQEVLGFSPGFLVAKISARFDAKQGADKFTLTAAVKIGSTDVDGLTIQFDPVQQQFTAKVPSPTSAVRHFDFSQTGTTALDFLCKVGGCPLPGNILPLSRADPLLVQQLPAIPLVNLPPSGLHSFYTVFGKFAPGTTFAMDDTKNLDLTIFCGVGSIPYPTSQGDIPVSVTLSIDGKVIATTTSAYKHP